MQPTDLVSIGFSYDDLYRNDDGDLRVKPDVCHHSIPAGLEECWGCFLFDADNDECRYTEDLTKK